MDKPIAEHQHNKILPSNKKEQTADTAISRQISVFCKVKAATLKGLNILWLYLQDILEVTKLSEQGLAQWLPRAKKARGLTTQIFKRTFWGDRNILDFDCCDYITLNAINSHRIVPQ